MSQKATIIRYHGIIQKLRQQPSTFDEIVNYLYMVGGEDYELNISKRTFQRDVDDILSIYNIEIKYDFSRRVYYIESDSFHSDTEHMLEAFDVFNALSMSERLSRYIHFQKVAIGGTQYIYDLLRAVENRKEITFSYHTYWELEEKNYHCRPYGLKEFNHRWYLVAWDTNEEKLKTFALDRLSNPSMTNRRFSYPKDFDVQEYFKDSFGIIRPTDEQKPQDIILSFERHQGHYIKSLPLHPSQEILIDNNHELRVKLRMYLTFDLEQEILSHGERVRVIEPEELVIRVKQELENASINY